MASRRRREGATGADPNTPAQQDEADVLAEVGAETDAESGDMLADEDRVREIGAVDAASVVENRRLAEVVDKKRGNVQKVPFNTDDPLVIYDTLIKVWPANTLSVSMQRTSGGSPVTYVLETRPRSSTELYAAMMAKHGVSEEATYLIKMRDVGGTQQFRSQNGRITLPDTRPQQQQGQPPMNGYQYPPVAHGYPQPQYPHQQQPYAQPAPQPYAQPGQPAQQQQPAPAPQPFVQVVPPPNPPPPDPMAMMGQMFKMFSEMQQQAQAAVHPPQPQQPYQPPPAAAMQPLPPPPQTNDPAVMMGWMQQMFGLFQQMQQQMAQRAPTPTVQPQTIQPPAPPPAPDPMAMMNSFFKMFMDMQQAVNQSARQAAQPAPYPRGPYQGPRPGYDPANPQQPYPQAPYAQPARQKTAAEQFRESITEVRSFAEAMTELTNAFPGQQPAPAAEREEPEDAPVKVMEVGEHKLVLDNRDGSVRKYETVVANLTPIMKWLGEQREAIQKSQAEKKQPPPQQLPPGYVEVGPGYQPPPGYVAVPVDQIPPQHHPQAVQPPPQQQALPQAPEQLFAQPIAEEPPPRRTWGGS